MVKAKNLIYIILFTFIIFMGGIMFLITPSKKISIIENRNLAQKPCFNSTKFMNGEYSSQFDDYVNDQIFGRTTLVKSYMYINLYVLKKAKVNYVVLGKNEYLLLYNSFGDFGNKEAQKQKKAIIKMTDNIARLNNYINSYGGQLYFIGIPNQISYYRDEYPKYFANDSKRLDCINKTMFSELYKKNVNTVNMYDVFKKSNFSNIYFKTDHHYNFNGAFLVYQATMNKIISQKNVRTSNVLKYNDFNIKTLSNPFIGSRNRQLAKLFKNDDKLQIGYPKEKIRYQKYDSDGKLDNELYSLPKNKSDEINYNVYMGGDNPETVIKTNRSKLDNLLIFGDSYTNAVEPLLFYNFNETRILDLRHYHKKSLYNYIKDYKPKVVVMIRDDESYDTETGNGDFGFPK